MPKPIPDTDEPAPKIETDTRLRYLESDLRHLRKNMHILVDRIRDLELLNSIDGSSRINIRRITEEQV